MAFELKSDLIDTFDQDRKWLVDFNAGKIRLILFGQSDNSGAIDMEIDESVLEEKSSFKVVGLPFSAKLDWGSYSVSIARTASMTIGAVIVL